MCGNMLPKPGVLMNPWNIGTTSTSTEILRIGAGYGRENMSNRMMRSEMCGAPSAPAYYSAYMDRSLGWNSFEFLNQPSRILLNLKPDER